jgi:hypothetical protein
MLNLVFHLPHFLLSKTGTQPTQPFVFSFSFLRLEGIYREMGIYIFTFTYRSFPCHGLKQELNRPPVCPPVCLINEEIGAGPADREKSVPCGKACSKTNWFTCTLSSCNQRFMQSEIDENGLTSPVSEMVASVVPG